MFWYTNILSIQQQSCITHFACYLHLLNKKTDLIRANDDSPMSNIPTGPHTTISVSGTISIWNTPWYLKILGGCLNIKMSSYQYRDPHVKDETVSWPSYLKHGNAPTWESRFLYWDGAQSVSKPWVVNARTADASNACQMCQY